MKAHAPARQTVALSRRLFHHGTVLQVYKAPMHEMKFLIDDVWKVQEHYKNLKLTGGANANPETVTMVLEEMAKFCENDLAPLNEVADSVGCKYISKTEIKTPPGFKEAYDKYAAGGWQGLNYPEALGGQGLPQSLSTFAADMCATANWTWLMYPGLSKGCINTLLAHGTEDLKKTYLPKLIDSTWTGTMCLTEPQAGSDLSLVKCIADPTGDGTYKINGTKIFISCGDHDMCENVVHCVLARLPNAPEGTRGISLFLVPKKKVDKDGKCGELNGVNVGRIEEKMGCHGSMTCVMEFENAEGYLIGTANKGLPHMFTFINTSRIGTAIQGIGGAESSFQNSLWYAKEREAMRALSGTKFPNKKADPIIEHPDVRRMLLVQKCIAEGGRSMVYECALLADLEKEAEAAGDKERAKRIDDDQGLLTPILKGFLTEHGVEAANLGIQIYGGHGYIRENRQEQVLRDVRIGAIWEGTTGIQALDLLGRKVLQQKFKPLNRRLKAIYGEAFALMRSGSSTAVKKHALKVMTHALQWQVVTYKIAAKATKNKDVIGIASVDYLMLAGYVTMAYHFLRMEEAATRERAAGRGNADFYLSKIQTSAFYFDHMLPRTRGHAKSMFTPVDSIMAMKPQHFSFDHAL
jgi:alkylation response protein AidB-like acyl-CoA dehydrogenase